MDAVGFILKESDMLRRSLADSPVTEANITDSAVHPEARIIPNALSKASIFWRDVDTTDLIHYAVAQHKILDGEDCKAFPAVCPIETLDFEKTRIAVPTARRT